MVECKEENIVVDIRNELTLEQSIIAMKLYTVHVRQHIINMLDREFYEYDKEYLNCQKVIDSNDLVQKIKDRILKMNGEMWCQYCGKATIGKTICDDCEAWWKEHENDPKIST